MPCTSFQSNKTHAHTKHAIIAFICDVERYIFIFLFISCSKRPARLLCRPISVSFPLLYGNLTVNDTKFYSRVIKQTALEIWQCMGLCVKLPVQIPVKIYVICKRIFSAEIYKSRNSLATAFGVFIWMSLWKLCYSLLLDARCYRSKTGFKRKHLNEPNILRGNEHFHTESHYLRICNASKLQKCYGAHTAAAAAWMGWRVDTVGMPVARCSFSPAHKLTMAFTMENGWVWIRRNWEFPCFTSESRLASY